jgi:site-specific DNA-methyltransferase (adenine-specific)
MQDIPDKSIDMILCDLPYGMTDCGWDSIIPFADLWKQYNRIIKENGPVVLFSAQPFTTKLIYSNIKQFKYCWYWVKPYSTGFCFAKYQPMRRVEDICVFYKKGGAYYPQGLIELKNAKEKKKSKAGNIYSGLNKAYTPKWTNYPTNILKYDGVKNRLHPTQKPVELLEYLIKTYTKPGEVVLDNCMGSGSTGEAAQNTGRRFIGIEKEKKFYEIAKERIKG